MIFGVELNGVATQIAENQSGHQKQDSFGHVERACGLNLWSSGQGVSLRRDRGFGVGPWAAGHRLLVAATWGLSPGVLRSLLTWQAFFLHAVSFNF